jgi:hypothetical protein
LPARRQDPLEKGVASGRFRAVQVRADVASQAIDALAEALQVDAISLDHQAIRTSPGGSPSASVTQTGQR